LLVGCEVGLSLVVVVEEVGIPPLDEALPAEVVDVDVVGFLFWVSDFEVEEVEAELALVLVESLLVGDGNGALVPSDPGLVEVVERLEVATLVPAADIEVKVIEASELVDTDGGGGATDVPAKPVAVGDDRRPLASEAEPLASPTEFDEGLDLLAVLLGNRVVGLTSEVEVVGLVGECAVVVGEVVGVGTLLVGGDREKSVAGALVPEKVAPLDVVG